jgi:RecB family exonuclease
MSTVDALQHQLATLRPGRPSLDWLLETLRDVQRDDPLQPVTVITPSPYLSSALRREVAHQGAANVSFRVQLRPLAERIARASGSRGFDRPLTGPLEAAAIRVALRASADRGLRSLISNPALQNSLAALFRDLAHLDDPAAFLIDLPQLTPVGATMRAAHATFSALTASFLDVPRQLRLAAELIAGGPARPTWASDIGGVIVYLLPRLDAADLQFLAALSQHLPVRLALARYDDAVADATVDASLAAVSAALGTSPLPVVGKAVPDPGRPHSVIPLAVDRDHEHVRTVISSAPDPDEEVRSVVRRLLSDAESGVPLWCAQVLYTADDPYAPLVRETLDAAGVAWHSALGRPASHGLAARSLLGLLCLRERDFAREAVLDWLGARPTRLGDADDPLPSVPLSAWDRLSRRAQVLQGAEQWVARLERLVEALELERQAREDWHADAHAHDAEDAPPAPANDVEHAGAIVEAIRRLQRDTRPPPEPTSWQALGEYARRLRTSYIRDDPSWPAAELRASEALDAALESLTDASQLEPTTSIGTFREALGMALDARRLEEGQAGVGVLVGPLGSSVGAAFDRTYVVGLAEGLLPSRLAPEPLLAAPAGQRDPLHRHQMQRAIERGAFLAVASGTTGGGTVHLSYARSDGAARACFPSRWLLEEAARCEGVVPLSAADLTRMFGSGRAWLEHIASAYDAVQRTTTSLNVADRRLGEVVAAQRRGQPLTETGPGARPDLILGRALRAASERRSRRFTAFDGNLAAIAADSRNILAPFDADSGASSATSLQRWANCPFHYFMVNVLRVEATERPEEAWTINPLDRGTLVHAVLEQFFRERFEAGRSTPDSRFTSADHTRLEEIADAWLIDLQQQGRTGHALAWENARASVVHDLHLELEREEAWRQDEQEEDKEAEQRVEGHALAAPALFERTFGDARDPESWAPVELDLGDGVIVRFRGAIDRVDVSPARILVIDYKTGGTWGYDGLDSDPVAAGRHLQLALYGRAARENVGDGAADVRAEYRFVSSRGRFERRQIAVDARTDARLIEVVRHAANGIRSGMFLPTPGAWSRGSFQHCRFCDYDRVCSTSRDEDWFRKSPRIPILPLEPRP